MIPTLSEFLVSKASAMRTLRQIVGRASVALAILTFVQSYPAYGSPLKQLLKLTDEAISVSRVSRQTGYSARRMASDRAYRARVLSSVSDPGLSRQLENAWSVAAKGRLGASLERERDILSSVRASGLASSKEVDALENAMRDLMEQLPIEAFSNQKSLQLAMIRSISAQQAPAKTTRATFELASGKLTVDEVLEIGSVQIKFGEISVYPALAVLSGIVICGKADCIETSADLALKAIEAIVEDRDAHESTVVDLNDAQGLQKEIQERGEFSDVAKQLEEALENP